jgi:hypothetical protein
VDEGDVDLEKVVLHKSTDSLEVLRKEEVDRSEEIDLELEGDVS